MKRCKDCGETKPATDFSPAAKGKGWRIARCKPCEATRVRARRKAGPRLSSGRRCPVEAVRRPDGSIELVKRGAA